MKVMKTLSTYGYKPNLYPTYSNIFTYSLRDVYNIICEKNIEIIEWINTHKKKKEKPYF